MTRKKNDEELDEVDCNICCCDVDCHNPCDGCCDYCQDKIIECCEPCTSCVKSMCAGFANIWYNVGWILQYLAVLACIGVWGYIVYYTFTCTKTNFTCDDNKKCTAEGKDPIEGAWTPELIVQITTLLSYIGYILTSVYVLGIMSGYFDQPFDKSSLKIEKRVWQTCKHMLKYFMVLPITATGFLLKPSGFSDENGSPMGMCYNNQLGNFLWGSMEVETMSQVGSFLFLVLFAILILNFCLMSCAREASFLCMTCTCFSEGCYQILCWAAVFVIWIGTPLAIVFQVSAYFVNFISPNNAVLALIAVSDVGYFLQLICAFAAPEDSWARRQYLEQKENQKTGSGVESTPINDRPSGGPVSQGGYSGGGYGGGSLGPTRGRDRRYEQAPQNDPEDPAFIDSECIGYHVSSAINDHYDQSGGYGGGNGYFPGNAGGEGDGNCDNDGDFGGGENYGGYGGGNENNGGSGGGMNVNINADLGAMGKEMNKAYKQYNKANKKNKDEQDEEQDSNEEDQDENDDGNNEEDQDQEQDQDQDADQDQEDNGGGDDEAANEADNGGGDEAGNEDGGDGGDEAGGGLAGAAADAISGAAEAIGGMLNSMGGGGQDGGQAGGGDEAAGGLGDMFG